MSEWQSDEPTGLLRAAPRTEARNRARSLRVAATVAAPSEACDDENNLSGDGCSAGLRRASSRVTRAAGGLGLSGVARCGDGFVAKSGSCDAETRVRRRLFRTLQNRTGEQQQSGLRGFDVLTNGLPGLSGRPRP